MIRMIKKTLYRLYGTLGKWYLTPLLLREWKNPSFLPKNERTVEYAFAFKWLSKIFPVEVLDVGPGKSAWPHVMATCGVRVTAIDKIEGYWRGGLLNRHYYIVSDDITKSKIKGQFDLITCISTLEHIPDHKAAVAEMFRLLKPDGYLVLTLPYNEEQYVDNVYKLPDAGYGQDFTSICQVFSPKEIAAWLKQNAAKIIDQEYYKVFTGDLWTFGKRISPPRKVKRQEKCDLICLLIQKT